MPQNNNNNKNIKNCKSSQLLIAKSSKIKTAQSVIRRSIRILINTNKYHQHCLTRKSALLKQTQKMTSKIKEPIIVNPNRYQTPIKDNRPIDTKLVQTLPRSFCIKSNDNVSNTKPKLSSTCFKKAPTRATTRTFNSTQKVSTNNNNYLYQTPIKQILPSSSSTRRPLNSTQTKRFASTTTKTRTPSLVNNHQVHRKLFATETKQRVQPTNTIRLARNAVRRSLTSVKTLLRSKTSETPSSRSRIPLPKIIKSNDTPIKSNQQQNSIHKAMKNENDDDQIIQMPKKLLIQLLQTPNNAHNHNNTSTSTSQITSDKSVSVINELITQENDNDLCKLSIKIETTSECLIVNKKININDLESLINNTHNDSISNERSNNDNNNNNNSNKLKLIKDKLINNENSDVLTPFAMRNLFKINKRLSNVITPNVNKTKSEVNDDQVVSQEDKLQTKSKNNKKAQTTNVKPKKLKNDTFELTPLSIKSLFRTEQSPNLSKQQLTNAQLSIKFLDEEPMDVDLDDDNHDDEIIGPTQQVSIETTPNRDLILLNAQSINTSRRSKQNKKNLSTTLNTPQTNLTKKVLENKDSLVKSGATLRNKELNSVDIEKQLKRRVSKKSAAHVSPNSMRALFLSEIDESNQENINDQNLDKKSDNGDDCISNVNFKAKQRKSFISDHFYPRNQTSLQASPVHKIVHDFNTKENEYRTRDDLLITPFSMRNLFKNKSKGLTASALLSPNAIRTLFEKDNSSYGVRVPLSRKSKSAQSTPLGKVRARSHLTTKHNDSMTPFAMRNLFKIKNMNVNNKHEEDFSPMIKNKLFKTNNNDEININEYTSFDYNHEQQVATPVKLNKNDFKLKDLSINLNRVVLNEQASVCNNTGKNVEQEEEYNKKEEYIEMANTSSQTQESEIITQIPKQSVLDSPKDMTIEERIVDIKRECVSNQVSDQSNELESNELNTTKQELHKETLVPSKQENLVDNIKSIATIQPEVGKKEQVESQRLLDEEVKKDERQNDEQNKEIGGNSSLENVSITMSKEDTMDSNKLNTSNKTKCDAKIMSKIIQKDEETIEKKAAKMTITKSMRDKKYTSAESNEDAEEEEVDVSAGANPKKSTKTNPSKKIVQKDIEKSQSESVDDILEQKIPTKTLTRAVRGKKQAKNAVVDLVKDESVEQEAISVLQDEVIASTHDTEVIEQLNTPMKKSSRVTKKQIKDIEPENDTKEKEVLKKSSARVASKKAKEVLVEEVTTGVADNEEPKRALRATKSKKKFDEQVEENLSSEPLKKTCSSKKTVTDETELKETVKTKSTRKKKDLNEDNDANEEAIEVKPKGKSTRKKNTKIEEEEEEEKEDDESVKEEHTKPKTRTTRKKTTESDNTSESSQSKIKGKKAKVKAESEAVVEKEEEEVEKAPAKVTRKRKVERVQELSQEEETTTKRYNTRARK